MFQLRYQSYQFSRSLPLPILEELPEFAQVAFTFCKDWLAGKETYLQQTSGSTGTPKLQVLTRGQLQASATATGAFFGANTEFKLLCCLNPSYIAGKMMLVRALVWDCEITLVAPNADPLATENLSFDFVALVPLQAETSLSSPSSLEKLKSIQTILIGGASLSDSLQQNLVKQEIPAWQTFGMTETVSHIALARIGTGELIYEVLPGVEIGISENQCLWIQSAMSGSQKIQTKDIVELRSKNSFVWLGRADFVVNSGGIKLFPEQLEKKISAWMGVSYSGVPYFFYGESDDRLGQRLVLYVEGEASQFNLEALKEGLQKLLGKFEVPKQIYFNPKFTYTETGKINRLLTANPS